MIKKIIALTLCLIMAFTLLGVITVSASINDAKTVFLNDGSSTSSYNVSNSTASVDDGAVKFYFSKKANGLRFLDVQDLKLIAGGEYVVSFKAKANTGKKPQLYVGLTTNGKDGEYFVRTSDKRVLNGGAYAPVISDEYDTYSFTFGIDKFVISKNDPTEVSHTEVPAYLYFDIYSGSEAVESGSAIWIDDLTITQKGVPEITCSVSGAENGTVLYDGNPVTDGYKFFKTAGKEVTLDVTPNAGCKAVVTKDGNELTISNNKVTFTAEDDTAINVAFTSAITGEMVLVHDTCGKGGSNVFSSTKQCTSSHTDTQYKWTISSIGSGYLSFTNSETKYTFTNGAEYQVDVKLGVENALADTNVLVVVNFVNGNLENRVNLWCNNNETAEFTGTFTSKYSGSAPIKLEVHGGTSKVGTSIILDEITVKQLNVPKVSVSVGANGSVTYDGNPVADGYSTGMTAGSTMTFGVTPNAGYKAVVTQDGVSIPVVNNQVTITIPAVDTDIAVSFEALPVVNPDIDDEKTVARFTSEGIYVYSKINEFTTSAVLNYGIYLGNQAWEKPVPLYAHASNSTTEKQVLATATPGAAFVIKVLGADPAESYTVKSFVGEENGAERTLSYTE